MKARDYSKPYRVTHGKKFRLDDVDPDETRWVKNAQNLRYFLGETIEHYAEHASDLEAQADVAARLERIEQALARIVERTEPNA